MHHLLKCFAITVSLMALGVGGVVYRTVQLEAGGDAELPCHELEDAATFKMWVTPNRGLVTFDYNPDTEHYVVEPFNGSLYVHNVSKVDSGKYLCVFQPGGSGTEYKNVTVTMNVLDVSYLPEIDDWEANLIRGIIAAVCTAAFFTGACALSHFSWHNRHIKKAPSDAFEVRRRSSTTSASRRSVVQQQQQQQQASNGVDNPALSVDAKELESGM